MNPAVALSTSPAEPEISIDIRDAHWGGAGFDATVICRTAASEAIAAAPDTGGSLEISVVLADDAFVRDLNRIWRNMDVPTNVLAFPCADDDDTLASGAERLLGDVIVAFGTTQREAIDLHVPLAHHFAHLIVHGVLHLLGYDHVDDDDAATMEKLEADALARMGIANPYEAEAADG